MNAGVQAKVLDLFWKESLCSDVWIPDDFLGKYQATFPHYSPLDLAIECQSGWQITEILLENGAQVGYVNLGAATHEGRFDSHETALARALSMYAEIVSDPEHTRSKNRSCRIIKPEHRLPLDPDLKIFYDENGDRPTKIIEQLLGYGATVPEVYPEQFQELEKSHPGPAKKVIDLLNQVFDLEDIEDKMGNEFETVQEIFMDKVYVNE